MFLPPLVEGLGDQKGHNASHPQPPTPTPPPKKNTKKTETKQNLINKKKIKRNKPKNFNKIKKGKVILMRQCDGINCGTTCYTFCVRDFR